MSDPQTEAIIGAAIEVHKHHGPGFDEDIYEDSLCYEFDLRQISYTRQHPIDVHYKGKFIKKFYIDLVGYGDIVLELKAQNKLPPQATTQIISYMKAGKFSRGLLINFAVPRLIDGIQRFVL